MFGRLGYGRAKEVVGEPETVLILSAPSVFARDSAELEVDFGIETMMSISPYDAFSGASIGVPTWV